MNPSCKLRQNDSSWHPDAPKHVSQTVRHHVLSGPSYIQEGLGVGVYCSIRTSRTDQVFIDPKPALMQLRCEDRATSVTTLWEENCCPSKSCYVHGVLWHAMNHKPASSPTRLASPKCEIRKPRALITSTRSEPENLIPDTPHIQTQPNPAPLNQTPFPSINPPQRRKEILSSPGAVHVRMEKCRQEEACNSHRQHLTGLKASV